MVTVWKAVFPLVFPAYLFTPVSEYCAAINQMNEGKEQQVYSARK